MRILGARWTKRVNIYEIECAGCDYRFWHPADKKRVTCPKCYASGNLDEMRNRWQKQN